MNRNEFIENVLELGIEVTDKKIAMLQEYYNLLVFWNKKINLTSITEEADVYLKHFYDSLTLVKVIDLNGEETFCDIGTGAGFPGIVIKIFFPHLKLTLVDALNKRVNFLNFAVKQLGLKNVDIIHARAEEYALSHREEFDVVTARAVASMNILLEYSLPIVKVNKYFIAMKGFDYDDYNNALKALHGKVILKQEFLLPNENSKRTIIKIQKLNVTNKKFPRKFSEIKKKPL